jgi:hypothetical protein
MGEEGQNLPSVTNLKDAVLAGIAPTPDVIDGPREFKTQRTCHGTGLYPSQCSNARSGPAFLFKAEPSKMWTQPWQGHYFVFASEARN